MTRRGSFGPVILLGLGAAGLAAVAGNKPLVVVPEAAVIEAGGTRGFFRAEDLVERYPLLGALALVLLAGWGVVLVTRGVARRGAAGLALLFAVALTSLTAFQALAGTDAAARSVARRVARGFELADASAQITAWGWVLLAAGCLSVLAAGLAVVLAPHWPEMGSKYDAPTDRAAGGTDLWKSLDAGHDPTAD